MQNLNLPKYSQTDWYSCHLAIFDTTLQKDGQSLFHPNHISDITV